MADPQKPDAELRLALGCADRAGPDYAARPSVLRTIYREGGIPVNRQNPLFQETVPTTLWPCLVSREGSEDAGSAGRRNLLRAHARPGSGEYPLHQRFGRPVHLSRLVVQ